MRVAVLDDYYRRAHEFADWDSLGAEVDFPHEPIPRERLAAELAGFDVPVLMRCTRRWSRTSPRTYEVSRSG